MPVHSDGGFTGHCCFGHFMGVPSKIHPLPSFNLNIVMINSFESVLSDYCLVKLVCLMFWYPLRAHLNWLSVSILILIVNYASILILILMFNYALSWFLVHISSMDKIFMDQEWFVEQWKQCSPKYLPQQQFQESFYF